MTGSGVAPGHAPSAVVVGTRGGDDSFAPVHWASDLAHHFDAPLVVVDAHPAADSESTDLENEAHRRALAAQLGRRLDEAGLHPSEVRCELGTPSSVLRAAAAGARVLVVGSHLAKADRRLGHGHLARDLARHLACPLLVVPHGRTARPDRVVVGVTGRDGDSTVFALAAELAGAFGRPITVVHVADPLSSMFDDGRTDPDEQHARHLADAHGVELVVRVGERTAAEILDVAATRSGGLVVVGSKHGRGPLGTILGEVTADLLDQDRVAVAVVPDTSSSGASPAAR